MPIRKVLVPNTLNSTVSVDGLPVELVIFDPFQPLPVEHQNAEVLIHWAYPVPILQNLIDQLPELTYLQLLSSGSEFLNSVTIPAWVKIAGGQSLHDTTVAEHALALLLAGARHLNILIRSQIGHRWATEWSGVHQNTHGKQFDSLIGANILIWGYGSIARTLRPYLELMGATVTAVASEARLEDGLTVHSAQDLPQYLPQTDALVMILPETPATMNALHAELLQKLPPQAWVVNVGRGKTINEADLYSALRSGQIAGAAVDVTAEEPLPASSPLWDCPNFILSPHAAGARPQGVSKLLAKNISSWISGEPLANQVVHPS